MKSFSITEEDLKVTNIAIQVKNLIFILVILRDNFS